MKYSIFKYNPKWTAILIVVICLSGMLIGNYVQRFRISEYRWIYQLGSFLNFIMVLSALCWSSLHPLLVWYFNKSVWKNYLIWIILGLIPTVYFITMMIMVEIRFGDKISWI